MSKKYVNELLERPEIGEALVRALSLSALKNEMEAMTKGEDKDEHTTVFTNLTFPKILYDALEEVSEIYLENCKECSVFAVCPEGRKVTTKEEAFGKLIHLLVHMVVMAAVRREAMEAAGLGGGFGPSVKIVDNIDDLPEGMPEEMKEKIIELMEMGEKGGGETCH